MPRVSGFKRKLAVYFLLLSLVPTAAVVWSFMSVSGRSETRSVDEGLQAGLRIALTGYQSRVDGASAAAARLARNRRFQIALQRHDRKTLAAMIAGVPGASVTAGRIRIGRTPAEAVRREADVVTSHGLAGVVAVSVAVDGHLLSAVSLGCLTQGFAHEIMIALQIDNGFIHMLLEGRTRGFVGAGCMIFSGARFSAVRRLLQAPVVGAVGVAAAMCGKKPATVFPKPGPNAFPVGLGNSQMG